MILKPLFERWCVWQFGELLANGKRKKIPINPKTGEWGSINNPATLGTFDEARARFDKGRYAGLGVLMSSGDGVICVDVDDCLSDDGTPSEIAAWTLQNFAGYCEVSQSGHGLHFFVRAVKPEDCATKVKRGASSLEIYGGADTRFICVTGKPHQRETCGEVINEQAALDRFIEHFGFLRETANPDSENCSRDETDSGEQHSDEEIIKLLLKRNKRGRITRLWAGETTDYKGDHSAADQGLAAEIAYYTLDAAQLERIFSKSALADRDKWRDRADYRKRTTQKALDTCKSYYWDKQDGKAEPAKAAQALAVKLTGGVEGLQLSKAGKPLSNIDNATQILLRDHRTQGALGFNEFSGAPEVLRPLRDVFGPGASNTVGEIQEHDITAVRAWFNRESGITLSKGDAWDVVIHWARFGMFNPVTSRLDQCAEQWDGVARLDTWLRDYIGTEEADIPEFLRSVGRGWMVGAVARAYSPGCKMDTVLVLEGLQGAKKSQAVRVLAEAVYPQGFTDSLPSFAKSEETARAMRGVWIAEIPELSSIQGRVEFEQVKAFITTQEDSCREPYARRYMKWKRTAVFAGTTNETEYVRDVTGGRRFWGVKVGTIDIDRLRQDAAQLWGEAVHAFRNGEAWHIRDDTAAKQADEQQRSRMFSDSWDDAITDFARARANKKDALAERWELKELYRDIFPAQNLDERPQADQARFGTALRRCGFARQKLHGLNRWLLAPETVSRLRED